MDSIGLLAAWVGIISFTIVPLLMVALNPVVSYAQRWWARTSRIRGQRRIERLQSVLAAGQAPSNADIADLVHLYGAMIVNLISGAAIVLVSIQVLDLGPSLLAAALPFSINAKLITRATGIVLFASSYVFVFRLCYCAVKLDRKTVSRRPTYVQSALTELSGLTGAYLSGTQPATRS